eukprot:maker-scaffold310_size212938-snap-gene-0.10 protein:Tk03969 transcript:maker-scaffold310_size212938-snap-gene-0.10-mRNA-1 annotation:"hypothetical protein"
MMSRQASPIVFPPNTLSPSHSSQCVLGPFLKPKETLFSPEKASSFIWLESTDSSMASMGLSLFLVIVTLVNLGESATNAVSCGNCRPPKFQEREFYLPFCAEDEAGNRVTHKNVCEAICRGKFTKGSCDGCETKCTAVFVPVCTLDQSQLFANSCHAKCSGLSEDKYKDCEGLNIVIPGKTKLPPNHLLPKRFQTSILQNTQDIGVDDVQDKGDQDV